MNLERDPNGEIDADLDAMELELSRLEAGHLYFRGPKHRNYVSGNEVCYCVRSLRPWTRGTHQMK